MNHFNTANQEAEVVDYNEDISAEEELKQELGPVNMAFVHLDQPRGWKGFLAKSVVNGAVTAGLTVAAIEVRDKVKKRNAKKKIVPMNKAQ